MNQYRLCPFLQNGRAYIESVETNELTYIEYLDLMASLRLKQLELTNAEINYGYKHVSRVVAINSSTYSEGNNFETSINSAIKLNEPEDYDRDYHSEHKQKILDEYNRLKNRFAAIGKDYTYKNEYAKILVYDDTVYVELFPEYINDHTRESLKLMKIVYDALVEAGRDDLIEKIGRLVLINQRVFTSIRLHNLLEVERDKRLKVGILDLSAFETPVDIMFTQKALADDWSEESIEELRAYKNYVGCRYSTIRVHKVVGASLAIASTFLQDIVANSIDFRYTNTNWIINPAKFQYFVRRTSLRHVVLRKSDELMLLYFRVAKAEREKIREAIKANRSKQKTDDRTELLIRIKTEQELAWVPNIMEIRMEDIEE